MSSVDNLWVTSLLGAVSAQELSMAPLGPQILIYPDDFPEPHPVIVPEKVSYEPLFSEALSSFSSTGNLGEVSLGVSGLSGPEGGVTDTSDC